MCHHMILLAKASAARAVAQCEHGTLHLLWDRAVIQLQSTDILFVAQLLGEWTTDAAAPALCESFVHLQRFPSGNVHCWFGGVGLFLAPPDLDMLTSMIRTSAERLAVAAVDGDNSPLLERIAAHQTLDPPLPATYSPN